MSLPSRSWQRWSRDSAAAEADVRSSPRAAASSDHRKTSCQRYATWSRLLRNSAHEATKSRRRSPSTRECCEADDDRVFGGGDRTAGHLEVVGEDRGGQHV